ncbi:hypothetical protein BJ944DRAFT_273694 [Cunninghamella echinulata]|nr:hypothetical protein BJ944DRAFT_273694 [Cunninghamella echinulata]
MHERKISQTNTFRTSTSKPISSTTRRESQRTGRSSSLATTSTNTTNQQQQQHITDEQKEIRRRIAARAANAMAQVRKRQVRSYMSWGDNRKAVIKRYPDGTQEILVPQTLTPEQEQYEFPPRSRLLKKLAKSTAERQRLSTVQHHPHVTLSPPPHDMVMMMKAPPPSSSSLPLSPPVTSPPPSSQPMIKVPSAIEPDQVALNEWFSGKQYHTQKRNSKEKAVMKWMTDVERSTSLRRTTTSTRSSNNYNNNNNNNINIKNKNNNNNNSNGNSNSKNKSNIITTTSTAAATKKKNVLSTSSISHQRQSTLKPSSNSLKIQRQQVMTPIKNNNSNKNSNKNKMPINLSKRTHDALLDIDIPFKSKTGKLLVTGSLSASLNQLLPPDEETRKHYVKRKLLTYQPTRALSSHQKRPYTHITSASQPILLKRKDEKDENEYDAFQYINNKNSKIHTQVPRSSISASPTSKTGMVQLVQMFHKTLHEQQLRAQERMQQLETLLQEERMKREDIQRTQQVTMTKLETIMQKYQQQQRQSSTSSSLCLIPPPSPTQSIQSTISCHHQQQQQSIEGWVNRINKLESCVENEVQSRYKLEQSVSQAVEQMESLKQSISKQARQHHASRRQLEKQINQAMKNLSTIRKR